MSISARTILLLAALLATPLAQALGLGGLTGTGTIGAPLEAYVPLYLAPGEHATLKSVDVLPDAFARDDVTPLAELVARIARDGKQAYVHVTTNTPLRVERLRFRLRLNTTQGAIVGRYALRVASTSAEPSSSTSTASRSVRANDDARIVARSPASVAAPAQAGEDRYGPVRRGESLWTIARRIARAGDLQSTMRALHALNPDAFVGGDMNRLRVGVTLALPQGLSHASPDDAIATRTTEVTANATDTQITIDDEEAHTTSAAQSTNTDALDVLINEEAASAVPARDETMNESTARPLDEALVAPAAPRDEALAQRLAELDAKFTAIRAKYGQSSSPAGTVIDTTPVASSPDVEVPRVDEAPAPTTAPLVESMPVVTPQAARTPAVQPVPTTAPAADEGLPDWLLGGLVAGLLLAGVLVALPRLNRRLVAQRTQSTAADLKAADADRRAEVARKAENRVRLESEIQGLLKRKQAAPPEPEPPPAAAAPLADTTAPPLSPFEQTLDALAITQGGGLLENDREVAIDANIAHGRYAEAEVLLRETIKAHPRNVQAKLRLAEVYYITEKLDGFAAVAIDLKEHHRGELTDDEWQRVVRMGKIVAPDLALFSGPKAVGKRA
ncbi:MAG: FimV family protein [Gammaproteobacteria bacterium]